MRKLLAIMLAAALLCGMNAAYLKCFHILFGF